MVANERANRQPTTAIHFLSVLGPGLVTGAADDDPSGIGTYSQAGAQLGFGIGWTMLLTYPLMAAIQEISARVGRTTGCGIAGNLRRHYPNWLLQTIVLLLFLANTINIGADLSGMADANQRGSGSLGESLVPVHPAADFCERNSGDAAPPARRASYKGPAGATAPISVSGMVSMETFSPPNMTTVVRSP
jgi:hypothetical protein